ncbi:porin [Salicola sp. Rm-C-2C1-2]|uniref:porin n=1 Tax=Salicola sp. Rm-C-2C1-2 TaxID=3141321 RepID=UPI0032E46391
MKKKILALAVSGGLAAAPMGAMAAPEVYGIVDIGVEHYTDSDNASGDIFQGLRSVAGNSDGRDVALVNGLNSRLGVRGEEELDVAGLTASYNIELGIDVLDDGDSDTFTRLGWAALGGDWGKIKVGSQWQALYEFGGWNTHRTDVHGYGTYYRTTGVLSNSLAYGFRQDSAISYEYGGAWGHSDPFAAQVTLGVGEGSASVDSTQAKSFGQLDDDMVFEDASGNRVLAESRDDLTGGNYVQETVSEGVSNQNGITSIQAAAQYSFADNVSVNGVYVREFNDYGGVGIAEEYDPELYNLGARWNVTDAYELSVNYTQANTNNGNDDTVESIAIASMMDFGNGLTGHLGFSQLSDDRESTDDDNYSDIDLNTYGYIKQALSDRTDVRFELENIQYDNQADSSATVALVGIQHNF